MMETLEKLGQNELLFLIQVRPRLRQEYRRMLLRALAAAAVAIASAAAPNRAIAATDIPITPQYVARARSVARSRCGPDAQLAQMIVRTDDQGVAHLSQDPGAISMTFVLPSKPNSTCLVAATPQGQLGAMPMPYPSQTSGPLPNRFLDLASAIRKARAQGFTESPIQATLQMAPGPFGGTPHAAWTFMTINPGGVVNRTVAIDAGSGEDMTAMEQQAGQELSRGKMLAPNQSGDYRAMRREADAMAAKLNGAMRIARIDVIGRESGGRFIARQVHFVYVAPQAGFQIPVLEVDGVENSLKAKYTAMNPTGARVPTPLRPGTIDLVDALPGLLALAPGTNRSDLLLQLEQIKGPGDIYNGPFEVQAVTTGATTAAGGAYLPTERTDLYGKSVWRLLAVTYGALPGEGIASHAFGKFRDYVYVDALTGRDLSAGLSAAAPPMPADTFPQPGKVLPRRYNPGATDYPPPVNPSDIE